MTQNPLKNPEDSNLKDHEKAGAGALWDSQPRHRSRSNEALEASFQRAEAWPRLGMKGSKPRLTPWSLEEKAGQNHKNGCTGCAFLKCVQNISGWWFGTFFFSPYIGNHNPKLTNIFQRGWNHQPAYVNRLLHSLKHVRILQLTMYTPETTSLRPLEIVLAVSYFFPWAGWIIFGGAPARQVW